MPRPNQPKALSADTAIEAAKTMGFEYLGILFRYKQDGSIGVCWSKDVPQELRDEAEQKMNLNFVSTDRMTQ